MNLPNKITIARILLVPIMMLMPYIGITAKTSFGLPIVNIIILIIFLVASFTDYLDGHIARRRNIVTNFGKFLDPIADKLLVLAALVMLVEAGIIPGWIPIIIAAREFMVSAIRMLVATEGKVIAASKLGKIKTVTQMIAIISAFININNINAFGAFIYGELTGIALIVNIITTIMFIIATLATIISGIDYLKGGKDLLKDC